MIEQDVDVPMMWPWELTCKIACLALVNGCTFNEMVGRMMSAR